MWPVTVYARNPRDPPLCAGTAEAKLANTGRAGEFRRANERDDVIRSVLVLNL
jgi:hypothetical protein